jgi:lipopolysaccharide biosynthesis glycosyltransferase
MNIKNSMKYVQYNSHILMFIFMLLNVNSVSTEFVEIVSIVDQFSLQPCMVKIHSIIESSKHKQDLRFNFLALTHDTVGMLEKSLLCFNKINYVIKAWTPSPTFPNVTSNGFDTDVIYSRIYLPQIFNVNKYIYIDNDIVVNADLWMLNQIPLEPLAISKYTPRRKHPTASSHSLKYSSSRKPVMGFVYDLNYVHRHYLHSHFNQTHPLVKQVMSHNDPDLFFNGGVAVVDAFLWRQLGLTKQAENLIAKNNGNGIYSSAAVGDQGLFFLLLDGLLAALPPEYNMRRLPNKTVRFLEQQTLGKLSML